MPVYLDNQFVPSYISLIESDTVWSRAELERAELQSVVQSTQTTNNMKVTATPLTTD